MRYVTLGDVCKKASSNVAQKDILSNDGKYPIYGASGRIKTVNFYHQEQAYIAIVKDGAGVGRTMLLPKHSSVIGTMQYIIPNELVDIKYLYYAIVYMDLAKYYRGAAIPHIYFKDYQKEPLKLPVLSEQRRIAAIFEKIDSIINRRNLQLVQLEQAVKSRFIELFGDPKDNPKGYSKKQLKETCRVITGNTPSRAVSEYYGDHIEWIKTDNIVSGLLNPTTATESLSEKGMAVSRTVESGAILMACIAGSIASIGRVCVTDRKVAFNQQINAIVPSDYNILFLYVMLQISKEYLVDEINMALKGILSKSKLEEKTFYVPPMELQEQFAAFVTQVDKSKYYSQKFLTLCRSAVNIYEQEWMKCQTLNF